MPQTTDSPQGPLKLLSSLLLPRTALGESQKRLSYALPSFHPLQEKEVAFFVPWIPKLVSPGAAQSPGLLASWGGRRAAAGFCRRSAAGGHRRRWGGGHSQPKGGEGGRRPARVPGLVTAGGPGNPRPHTLAEMAGGDSRRVVGTLHLLLLLLLLAAVLSLTAGTQSPDTHPWTEEKVRGRFSMPYLSGSWRVPRPGTGPSLPALGGGGGSGMLSPCLGSSPHPAPGS